MPGEESVARCKIGRRRLVNRLSPARGVILSRHERVCSIERTSSGSALDRAQVSTTCWPYVFVTVAHVPALSRNALPLLAFRTTDSDTECSSKKRLDRLASHRGCVILARGCGRAREGIDLAFRHS